MTPDKVCQICSAPIIDQHEFTFKGLDPSPLLKTTYACGSSTETHPKTWIGDRFRANHICHLSRFLPGFKHPFFDNNKWIGDVTTNFYQIYKSYHIDKTIDPFTYMDKMKVLYEAE